MKTKSSSGLVRRPFLSAWARILLILAIALPQAFAVAVPAAEAAVGTVTAWARAANGTAGPYTITNATFSCGSGSNRLLVAVVTAEVSTTGVANVTATKGSGVNFTTAVATSVASKGEVWIGYLTESQIAGNTNSIVITNSSGTAWTGSDVFLACYSGVNQTQPLVTGGTWSTQSGSSSGTTSSLSIPVVNTGVVIYANARTSGSTSPNLVTISNAVPASPAWTKPLEATGSGYFYTIGQKLVDADTTPVTSDFTWPSQPYANAAISLNPAAALNTTTAGTATAAAAGLTSIAVSMPYADDANGDNTYTVDYKLTSDSSWTNWVTGASHTASPYATTITGLAAGTSYDVRVTYNDADGVTGINPQTISGVVTYYTLTVNSGSNGNVTLNPAGGAYAPGTLVTLTATGNSGYILKEWSGDLTGSANPATITMNGDKTVNASWMAGACITSSVSASSDDATQGSTSNTMYLTDTTLNTQGGSAQRWWGLRFPSITIPQGATIVSANATFRAASATTATPVMDVYGEDSDNAPAFTTTASDITNRNRTAAVVWNMTAWTAGSSYRTPDLTTPVQAIVNRAGWSSGNAIAILGLTRTSDSKVAVAWDDTTQENQASIAICYTVSNPTITTAGTLTAFNSALGLTSAEQHYTVSGTNLGTNPIVITPPADFELSLASGSGFSSDPISLTPSDGTVAATTIYVRLNPASQTTYTSLNITHTSSGATTKNVAVSGSSVPTITATSSMTAFSAPVGIYSAEKSYTVSAVNLTADLTIAPPADFEVSATSGGGFVANPGTLTVSPGAYGAISSVTIYTRFKKDTAGTDTDVLITHDSSGATQKTVAVSGTAGDPTLTVNSSMTAFSQYVGTPSSEQTYTVAGTFLKGDVTVTAPTDFEISKTTGTGFGPSLTFSPTGTTLATSTVYVRMNRSAAGSSGGNITHVSTDATTQNVAVSGAATVAPPWTAYNDVSGASTPANTTEFTIGATNGALLDFDTGLPTGATVTVLTSGTLTNQTSSGTATASGTDAYNTFNGKVNMVGVVQYYVTTPADFWMDLTFNGLNPTKTYTFVATANRAGGTGGTPAYSTRMTRYTISGIDAATNASTSGTSLYNDDPYAVYFCTGENTANGYVARWINIRPGSDGSFKVRAQPNDSVIQTYAYGMFMLQEEAVTDPTITTSGTLTAFSAPTGSPSAEQHYTVSGSNLTNDITITPPAYFEIALTSGGPWTTSLGTITLTPDESGTVAATTVYVRLNPSGASPYSGVITHESTGASQKDVAVSGAAGDPTITVSTASLTAFVTPAGTPSAEQSYTVAGSFLKGDIAVSAPADFEISKTSGGDWASSLTFTAVNNTVATSTVYVRFNRATVGSSGGNITHASTDATTKNVAVSGTATVAPTTVTFQEGVSGYAGTVDTTIKFSSPTTPYGDQVYFEWDTQEGTGDTPETGLLQFTGIFGSGADQIPLGSTITSATLRYRVYSNTNSNGDSASVYESLISWDEATTYNTFGSTAGVQGDDYNPTLVATAPATTASSNYTIDVTASLQRWAAGTANHGWVFLAVNTNGVEVHSSEAATADFRPLLTVSYVPGTTYTLTASDDGNGSVTLSPPSGVYAEDTVVKLTPVANHGYAFDSWDGADADDLTDNLDGTWSITMDADKSVTAHFAALPVVTLTVDVSPAGAGSVTLDPATGPYYQGDVVQLTAIPAGAYAFSGWSGDLTGKTNPTTITMSADKAVTAHFSRPPAAPALVRPADGGTAPLPPTLEVTVTDPDSATVDVSFYGRPKTGGAGDFSIVVLPDSQRYADFRTGYPDYSATFYAQTQWIADQKTARDIVFVTHVGDIVEDNLAAGWTVADAAFDTLDTAGVPYSVGIGNNDYTGTDYSLFESNFGVSRFTGKPWYGGHYGSNNVNSYSLFSASGMDFIVVNLNYNPSAAELDWANGLLTTYSNRRAIVESHNQLSLTDGWSNQDVYTALKGHANLFLMVSGHLSAATDGAAKRTDTDAGHTIYSTLQDYQSYTNENNGYLRIYRFSPANDKIYMSTYSPTLGAYETTDPDDTLELAYTMPDGPAYQLIGTVSGVASGSNASISWPGLADATEYEWYAVASDGTSSTTGPTWSFTTDGTAPTLDITGATADGEEMAGDLATGYILETTNHPALDRLIQFATGTAASEPLEDTYFGLKLISSTVTPAALEAYYTARGVPAPYLAYLVGAANGTNPFVYIKGDGTTAVSLVDAAKHDLGATDVPMTVPDNFPLGTYTVQGVIKDLAGNETTVTLILKVEGDRVAPELTITGATADGAAMEVDEVSGGYILETTNDPADDHLIQFASGTAANEPLAAQYFGLTLIATTVTPADLKAYYTARGVPEPYLSYLKGAADGTNPFVYIKGDGTTAVSLVDAAKHDIQASDADMTVPDDFPLGTYTVQGVIKDLAGNETTVTLKLVVAGDRVAPELTITGATADGEAMAGTLEAGYVLETLGDPAVDHLIEFAAGTVASEALQDTYFGLKLISSTVTPAELKAYYDARGVPEPYLAYLKAAADGTNPFVYIKGSTVTLVDAAKHDIQSVDVDMTVPDDFPPGTYTVAGQIRDVAGNATTVTLILIVTVDTSGPVLTITGATADGSALGGTLAAGYILPTTNNAALDHLVQFAAGTTADEELANQYFGLYLTGSTVTADFLKAYYAWKGVPEPYLAYLKGAADGTNPFVYIKGDGTTTAVTLVDAAKHDLGAGDVDMTVPDTFPSGTYTVEGVIKDLAGNETTVTLKLVVQGPALAAPSAPAVSIVKNGGNAVLSWPAVQTDANGNFIGTSGVTAYYVYYHETTPYFVPGVTPYTVEVLVPALSFTDYGVAATPGMKFYVVRAVNAKGSSFDSNRLGVFTYGLEAGQ